MMAAVATRSLIDRLPKVRGELVADAPLAPLAIAAYACLIVPSRFALNQLQTKL